MSLIFKIDKQWNWAFWISGQVGLIKQGQVFFYENAKIFLENWMRHQLSFLHIE